MIPHPSSAVKLAATAISFEPVVVARIPDGQDGPRWLAHSGRCTHRLFIGRTQVEAIRLVFDWYLERIESAFAPCGKEVSSDGGQQQN